MGRRRLPWDKLNWAEYDGDPALRLCSWAAQGVWPRMLKIMWFATERGFLLVEGKPPTVAVLAELWGKPEDSIVPLLVELEAQGVFSRDARGIPYCRRMERDERRRQADEESTPTDRQVNDAAVQAALVALNADEKRKAGQRDRQRRHRAAKRAKATLEQLRAFAALEAAAVRGNVTEGVTVTLPACGVTLHKSLGVSDLRPVSTEPESDSREEFNPERRSA